MAIPKYNELYVPLLNLLSNQKVYNMHEVYEIISDELNLTDEEMEEMLPSKSQTVIVSRIGWARTYLKKAGLVESPKRGYIQITDRGLKDIKENPNLTEDDLWKYPEFEEFATRKRKPTKKPIKTIGKPKNINLTPEEEMDLAYENINMELGERIIETINSKSPIFFERLVMDLLLKMGYGKYIDNAGTTTSFTGDEGIDGIINEDKLGLSQIGIQAKRFDERSKVGRPLIQNFAGALLGKGLTKGVFLTTSTFTKEAVTYAENQNNLSIILIDGEELANLMIEYELGTSTVNTYKIKRIDSDYFNIE